MLTLGEKMPLGISLCGDEHTFLTCLIQWVHFVLSFIAIADVFAKHRDWGTRIVLIAIIILVPIVGPGLYLLVLRPKD